MIVRFPENERGFWENKKLIRLTCICLVCVHTEFQPDLCMHTGEIGAPTNVTQLDATSTTVTIGFQVCEYIYVVYMCARYLVMCPTHVHVLLELR